MLASGYSIHEFFNVEFVQLEVYHYWDVYLVGDSVMNVPYAIETFPMYDAIYPRERCGNLQSIPAEYVNMILLGFIFQQY